MDSLPTEITQTIFDCSDLMSSLLLSMTYKRMNTIYNSNNYITSKDIPLEVTCLMYIPGYNKEVKSSHILNIRICNTLNTIIQRIRDMVPRMYDITDNDYISIYRDMGSNEWFIDYDEGMLCFTDNVHDNVYKWLYICWILRYMG